MHSDSFFFQAFIYLLAAVLSVPVAKRLGLGSVLGYLIAGVIIGPFVLGLVGGGQQEDVMHFAEFGVVLMLFIIGLELQPALLWRMRGPILGLGGLQVLLTTGAIAGLSLVFGLSGAMALAVGMIFALSSTAIVLQTLEEKGLLKTEAGQSAFSVLLFQDIAVIPMLALLPLLESPAAQAAQGSVVLVAAQESSSLPGWQQTLLVMGVVGGIIVAGRFLMRPVFRFIADTRLREIFTATALLLVIGIALLMQMVGLSPALGTFVAGVVLAESEYRHELEANIDPFKGLLLGLFFISVGASINFNLLFQQPLMILSLVVALMVIKALILLGLGWGFKLTPSSNALFALALAQGGEFGFVLFSFAEQSRVLPADITAPLVVVVALSMALTPLVLIIHERLVQPRFAAPDVEREPDAIDDGETPVIIAGFGRFGQIVGRLLIANGFRATVLDHDASHIEMLRKFGHKVFYGDSSRVDLLHMAGAEHAQLFVIAIDDPARILKTVDLVQKHFPHLKILARAIDRRHAYALIRRGVHVVERETFESAVDLGVDALKLLGFRAYRAHRAAQTFKHHDEEAMREMAHMQDDERTLLARSQRLTQDLEQILQADDDDFQQEADQAWDTSALREAMQKS